MYQRRLLDLLQRKFTGKFSNRDCPLDIGEIPKLNDFFSFDDKITAPLHGFAGVEDYYTRSSSRQYLQHH